VIKKAWENNRKKQTVATCTYTDVYVKIVHTNPLYVQLTLHPISAKQLYSHC